MSTHRIISRGLRTVTRQALRPSAIQAFTPTTRLTSIRAFIRTSVVQTGPPPTAVNSSSPQAKTLNDREYHEFSDEYLEIVCRKYEDLQDVREDVDVEFSSGVLTISLKKIGTYVINKQPPNKQIWLSSPISGPKRYDYVEIADGQGDWIYLRDSSSLSTLLAEETGVDIRENLA